MRTADRTIFVVQRVSRDTDAPARALALDQGPRRLRALFSELVIRRIPDRHQPGGGFRQSATGLVVGATSVIDYDVSILQNVTLGGTGNEAGDRHPKVRRGVMIGAGAKILGNIEIGACSRIAAGSVVLHPVPPNTTMAGVPARAVGTAGCAEQHESNLEPACL